MKTLIAEDDASSRVFLHLFLSRYGECDIAVNGKQAVEIIRAARDEHEKYDLICMDLRMPEMDGQEAMREIRAQEAVAGKSSSRRASRRSRMSTQRSRASATLIC